MSALTHSASSRSRRIIPTVGYCRLNHDFPCSNTSPPLFVVLVVHHPLSGIADKIMVVSMGDEISLADPWDAKDAFPKWCQVS
jgi:hypothetical protein